MNKFLLDTHALIWWWLSPKSLSKVAADTITNPHHQIFVSPINLWEMSIKYHKGKLNVVKTAIDDFEKLLIEDDFGVVQIKTLHARLAGALPQKHADPFDRMLVAQAKSEDLILISKDEKLQDFDVNILW